MKKLYSNLLRSSALALSLIFASGISASAYDEIKSGETLTIKGISAVYQFSSDEAGVLSIATNSYSQYAGHTYNSILYYNPAHDLTDIVPLLSRVDNRRGWTYQYQIQADVDYYFYVEVTDGSETSFAFNFEAREVSPEITGCYPAPNTKSAYNLSTYPELQLIFNMMGVEFDKVWLNYKTESGSDRIEVDYREISAGLDARIDIYVKEAIDKVKPQMLDKSVFSIEIVNPHVGGASLAGNYVNDEGNVVLEYYYEKQTSAISSVMPEKFLSFWVEGDPNGIIEIIFDGNLLPLDQYGEYEVPTLQIFAGTYTDGEDGRKLLPGAPMVLDGGKLTIDLCGVQRITDEKIVSIQIQNLLDENFQSIDYYGSGAISVWDIPYELLPQITLGYEFTPSSGSLANEAEIELWLDALTMKHVEINGFRYEMTGDAQPVEISMDDVKVEPDPVDPESTLMYIPVPEIARDAEGVKLSAILTSLDGYDTYEIYTVYGDYNGVEAIEDASEFNVFSLSGISLLRKGSAADLRVLPAGLYIVNGRLIRKL